MLSRQPRRRFQFSLRGLLLLTTLAAMLMPWMIAEYRAWRSAKSNDQGKGTSYDSGNGIYPFKPKWNPKPMIAFHRLRFSLRTLFVVVTVIAVLVGWVAVQLRWKLDRKRTRNWAIQHFVTYYYPGGDASDAPSWGLRLLGEHGIPKMVVKMRHNESDEALLELKRAFPECQIEVERY